jgi:RHS repeat-associated protein
VKFKLKISGTIEQASVVYRCVLLFFIFATCSQASIPNFTQADIAYSGDHRVEVYTHGPDLSGTLGGAGGISGILADFRPQTSDLRFFHADAMGNVVLTTDSSGDITSTHRYTPFGRPITSTGSYQPRFGFSSKEYDPETGLNNFGYRSLVVNQGRWLNRDPLGEVGGLNLYGFVSNNGLFWIDPLGLDSWWSSGAFWVDVGSEAIRGGVQGAQHWYTGVKQVGAGIGDTAVAPWNYGTDSEFRADTHTAIGDLVQCVADPCCRSALAKEMGESFVQSIHEFMENPSQGLGKVSASALSGGGVIKAARIAGTLLRAGRVAPKKIPVNELPSSGGKFILDSKGNTIPLKPGETFTGSPDGKWIQVRGPDGKPTGLRLDGPHKPSTHQDPRALQPHGHVPGVTNPDGTPWLPVNQ